MRRRKKSLEVDAMRLRHATIAVLSHDKADMGLVEDIVGEAYYHWMVVNRKATV